MFLRLIYVFLLIFSMENAKEARTWIYPLWMGLICVLKHGKIHVKRKVKYMAEI